MKTKLFLKSLKQRHGISMSLSTLEWHLQGYSLHRREIFNVENLEHHPEGSFEPDSLRDLDLFGTH